MKLRLTQPGFETYTGQMGVLFFEDGASTADAKPNDARRMAATMLCEYEDGTSPSDTQAILDNMDTPAPVFAVGDAEHDRVANATETVRQMDADKPLTSGYTQEQLGAIADKDGIGGLRKIAEPMGIKGNSITGLIDAILKSQAALPQVM